MADYNLTGCLGTITVSDPPAIIGAWVEYGTWPVWANLSGGYIIVFNAQLGVTNLQIVNNTDPENPVYASVQITTTNCYEEGQCLQYPLHIVWLNPEGGFSSYNFSPKKSYNVDIGSSSTMKDSDLITRYVSINNIYDTTIQPSGFIPETHVDLLKSLRYSQQAWVVVDSSNALEIFNYAKSFELKKQANGFYKYDFEFSYSSELLTQNG